MVDFGCGTTKIGLGGGDSASCVLPGIVGVAAAAEASGDGGAAAAALEDGGWWARRGARGSGVRYQPCPTECLRAGVAYRPLVDPAEGLLKDWDGALAQFEWAVGSRLGAGRARGSEAPLDVSAHPVLLVEQAYTSKAEREKWAQILFEEYNVPGVFMSRAGVLALYANARVTGLAVDVGAGGTTITPVQEGYPLMGGLRRSPVGGRVLDLALQRAAAARSVPLHPRYPSVRSKATGSGAVASSSSSSSSSSAASAAAAILTPTVRSFHALELARDARESLCRVFEGPFDAAAHAHVPLVTYDLPDGTKLQLGPERYAVPELLFDPSPLHVTAGGAEDEAFAGCVGIPDMVQESVLACEAECRRDLLSNITLTGGGSTTEGLSDRLLKELLGRQQELGARAKLSAASNSERQMGPWLGGSILASLGTFPEIWFSKQEYAEYGAKMLHRKVL